MCVCVCVYYAPDRGEFSCSKTFHYEIGAQFSFYFFIYFFNAQARFARHLSAYRPLLSSILPYCYSPGRTENIAPACVSSTVNNYRWNGKWSNLLGHSIEFTKLDGRSIRRLICVRNQTDKQGPYPATLHPHCHLTFLSHFKTCDPYWPRFFSHLGRPFSSSFLPFVHRCSRFRKATKNSDWFLFYSFPFSSSHFLFMFISFEQKQKFRYAISKNKGTQTQKENWEKSKPKKKVVMKKKKWIKEESNT